MANALKKLVETGLQRFGLKLSLLRTFPIGNDLCLDLSKFTVNHPLATIFDVGANDGATARTFAAAFPAAKVFSFEPVSATYHRLAASTERFPNVRCFNFALSNSEGSMEIYLQKNSEWNSLQERVNAKRSEESSETETIHMRTLDGFCAAEGIGRIDLLKIDTEGFELQVLQGADSVLNTNRVAFVYCEISFDVESTQHTSFFAVHEHLTKRGFRFVALYEQFVHENMLGSAYTNALFVNPAAFSHAPGA